MSLISLKVLQTFWSVIIKNLTINHRLYRGLDERDGANALSLGVEFDFHNFEIFNVASGSPFDKDDLILLKNNPKQVFLNKMPAIIDIYEKNGWSLPTTIDRVYRSDKASRILGYKPKYTFEYLINNPHEII